MMDIATYALMVVGFGVILYLFVLRDIFAALNPDYVKVHIVHRTDDIKTYFVKKQLDGNATIVSIKGYDYTVPLKVYRTGIFRVPTIFFSQGKQAAVSLDAESSTHESTDISTIRRQSFVLQLMKSFQPAFLTPETQLAIIVGATLLGAGIVYYLIGQKLDGLQELIMSNNNILDTTVQQ